MAAVPVVAPSVMAAAPVVAPSVMAGAPAVKPSVVTAAPAVARSAVAAAPVVAPSAVAVAPAAANSAEAVAPDPSFGGGGAIAWRCVAPPAGDDSSAAAKLRLATLAYKYVIAARFLQAELDVGAAPAEPTPLYLDAQAVLDGTNCERLVKSSRWLAMRYAMLRWGIACGTIAPRKLLTAMNPADGLTKCLTGKAFENARARLLGLPPPHPPVPPP
jgi:hypothetical protein